MSEPEIDSKDLFVTADGRRLAARRLRPAAERRAPQEAAADTRPVLVFLHEGLGSIAQWQDFPAALVAATGLPGLVYERWGFGRSEPLELPRPTDYLRREAERALPDLLAACGIARPILVGHSDGATIALLYAAAFPEKPVACITEAAHVFVEAVTLAGVRAAKAQWEGTDLKQRLARYHGNQVESLFSGWADTWLRPEFAHWSMLDRLAAITCPLLAIQGSDDEYGTTAQVEAIVAGVSGPAEPLLIPNCGHSPHLQARATTLEAMTAFLQRVLSTPHAKRTSG